VTLLTNICVCVVLVRPNMRSATNTLLVAMAVSDTLTGLCPLPAYFRFRPTSGSTRAATERTATGCRTAGAPPSTS